MQIEELYIHLTCNSSGREELVVLRMGHSFVVLLFKILGRCLLYIWLGARMFRGEHSR